VLLRLRLLALVAVFAGLAGAANPANAGFVNGVETFDGTTIDLATWREWSYPATSAPFSQDGALTLSPTGFPSGAELETIGTPFAVGDWVSAQIRVNSLADVNWNVGLFATSGDGGGSVFGDSRFFGLYALLNEYTAYLTGGGNPVGPASSQPTGLTYTYRLEHPAADTFAWDLFDDQGALIGSRTQTSPVYATSASLHIDLYSQLGSFTFDDVTIGTLAPPVPEPLSAALAALGAGAFALRRKR
jgi:hypothetical protein